MKIRIELENVFKIDGVDELFSNFEELKNERTILLPTGDSYQPDRVMVKNKTTYLVDYKTGKQNPKHVEQITNYKSQTNPNNQNPKFKTIRILGLICFEF